MDTLEIEDNAKYIAITTTLACGPKCTMEDTMNEFRNGLSSYPNQKIIIQEEEAKHFCDEKRD